MSYATARSEFDKIATHGGSVLCLRRTRAAQVELVRAHVRRWPGSTDLEQVGCLCEEVGELTEAPAVTLRLELQDVLVCAAMLATSHRLDFATVLDDAEGLSSGTFRKWSIPGAAGLVARVVVKAQRRLRGLRPGDAVRFAMHDALLTLAIALQAFVAGPRGWDLGEVFVEGAERKITQWRNET